MRIFKASCNFIPKDETIEFSSKNADNMTFNTMKGITLNIKKVEKNLIEAEIEIKVGEENYSEVQEQNSVNYELNDENQKIFKKEFLKLQTWYSFYNLDLSYDPKNLKMSVPKGTTITRQISLEARCAIKNTTEIKSLEVEEFFKKATLSPITEPVTEHVLEINALAETIKIKNIETISGLLGEEKLVIPLIFFWICRIYFHQRSLNDVSRRKYDDIFKSGMDYVKKYNLDFEQMVQDKIIEEGNDKIKTKDKQHINIAFDLGLQENSDQFHDLAILRPIRNLAVHFYYENESKNNESKNSVESFEKRKDNLIKFITSQTDNYISIAKEMVKKCSETVVSEHKELFQSTNKFIDTIK